MKFDASKDKVLYEKEVEANLSSNIIVKVASYDGAAPGMQLSRKNFKEEWPEPRFAKLGRIKLDEWKRLSDALIEAEHVMENWTKEE